MTRAIVAPAVLPPSALADLKQWLGITTAQDDAPLRALLAAALDLCEQFTGQVPLVATFEEVLPATSAWQRLSTVPVQSIDGMTGIPADAPRFALASTAYDMDLESDGSGYVRIRQPGAAGRVAVRFTAGIAADWAALPEALRHGIIRLAAHQHRMRDADDTAPAPPLLVAALWRPWRRMRLL